VDGYLALLRRLLDPGEQRTVYAPVFERDLEQPLAGAVAVGPDVRLVVTEGNYLLLDRPGWRELKAVLDETWFLDLDDEERVRRLVTRHEVFGKPKDAAVAWVAAVDEPNAALIRATSDRADLVVGL
jgi:pantothenate kinase